MIRINLLVELAIVAAVILIMLPLIDGAASTETSEGVVIIAVGYVTVGGDFNPGYVIMP